MVDAARHYITGLEQPDWTVGADLKKPLTVETRHRLLNRAVEEQLLVAGDRFSFPDVERILPFRGGFR